MKVNTVGYYRMNHHINYVKCVSRLNKYVIPITARLTPTFKHNA